MESLKDAINRFENMKFDREYISNHAKKFASNVFDNKFKEFVMDCYNKKVEK